MTQATVGQRLRVGQQLCTVRYVGNIANWLVEAVGVEWDDPSRGKHSGSLDGTSYFSTSVAGLGLFLKSLSAKIDWGRPLDEVVHEVYVANDNLHGIQFSQSKTTESLGWARHNEKTQHYTELESISLDNRAINLVATTTRFPRLERLDLLANLFTDFGEVVTMLRHMPALKSLNLNGNRFAKWASTPETFGVTTLTMASTMVTWDELTTYVLPLFPELKELVVLFNNYETIGRAAVASIDLGYNNLVAVPALECVLLKLNNNRISHIDHTYESMDLRHNAIATWSEIDKLASVKRLRINHNPVFAGWAVDDQIQQLIARLDVIWLDGSLVSAKDRQLAELWFISQVHQGKISFAGPKWDSLLRNHGVSATAAARDLFPMRCIKIVGVGALHLSGSALMLAVYGEVATKIGRPVTAFLLVGRFGVARVALDDWTTTVNDVDVDCIEVEQSPRNLIRSGLYPSVK